MARVWELAEAKQPSPVRWGSWCTDDIELLGTAPTDTRMFTQRPNYRFWMRRNGWNQQVRYCYTVRRNVAGYFTGWVETLTVTDAVIRRQWLFRRKKSAVMKIQKRRWEKARG